MIVEATAEPGAAPGDSGSDEARTSLVLVPGLLCDDALWAPQVTALSDVAACWIPGLLSEDSMSAMARSVLCDVPFDRFALAGLSMGGYVCMEIMRQAPQRVTGLALLDTRAAMDVPEETRRRHELVRLAQTARAFQPVTKLMLPLLMHPSRQQDEVLVKAVTDMAERVGIEAYVRQQRAIMSRPDSRADLRRVRAPSIVVCGRQDALTTLAQHKEMAALIPGAELVVIEECGHISSLERPEEVTVALRGWLKRI
jgi:pimeloyl-ACP methyl ester carboxylesterase